MLRELLLAAPVSGPILTIGDKTVHARKLSGPEVMDAKLAMPEAEGTAAERSRFVARLVTLATCDAEGNRVFTDEDIDAVAAMPYGPFMKLVDGVMSHNGMGDEAKNSSAPSTEGS